MRMTASSRARQIGYTWAGTHNPEGSKFISALPFFDKTTGNTKSELLNIWSQDAPARQVSEIRLSMLLRKASGSGECNRQRKGSQLAATGGKSQSRNRPLQLFSGVVYPNSESSSKKRLGHKRELKERERKRKREEGR